MTTAQRLIAEGEAKGRTEGEAKGRAEVLVRLIGLRFWNLPPDVEARVRSASSAELDLWAERILSAQTIEDVLR